MISPMAPSRTTKMRTGGLGPLTPVNMFVQSRQSLRSGRLFTDHFIGPNLFESLLKAGGWQCEYVVYHAKRGRKLGPRPRREQWIGRIEHDDHELLSIREAAKTTHLIGSQHIEITGYQLETCTPAIESSSDCGGCRERHRFRRAPP